MPEDQHPYSLSISSPEHSSVKIGWIIPHDKIGEVIEQLTSMIGHPTIDYAAESTNDTIKRTGRRTTHSGGSN